MKPPRTWGQIRSKTFLRVTLPLSMPGVVAGTILVFIPVMGTFIVSDILGGRQVILVGNLIQRSVPRCARPNLWLCRIVDPDDHDVDRDVFLHAQIWVWRGDRCVYESISPTLLHPHCHATWSTFSCMRRSSCLILYSFNASRTNVTFEGLFPAFRTRSDGRQPGNPESLRTLPLVL